MDHCDLLHNPPQRSKVKRKTLCLIAHFFCTRVCKPPESIKSKFFTNINKLVVVT